MAEPFWLVLLAGWISIWDILRILILFVAGFYLVHLLISSYFYYQTKHHIDVHNHRTNNPLRAPQLDGTPHISKDDI